MFLERSLHTPHHPISSTFHCYPPPHLPPLPPKNFDHTPVHTVWCDNVGFNDKLLLKCSSKAFSSITYGFRWDDSDVIEWFGQLKCSATPDFFLLIVSDISALLSKTFEWGTSCLSYVPTVGGLFKFGAWLVSGASIFIANFAFLRLWTCFTVRSVAFVGIFGIVNVSLLCGAGQDFLSKETVT